MLLFGLLHLNQPQFCIQFTSRDDAFRERLAQLSEREREVMELMIRGRLNKQIAGDLGIAMRTVEVHRARVLDKMGVRNAVELAALLGKPEF